MNKALPTNSTSQDFVKELKKRDKPVEPTNLIGNIASLLTGLGELGGLYYGIKNGLPFIKSGIPSIKWAIPEVYTIGRNFIGNYATDLANIAASKGLFSGAVNTVRTLFKPRWAIPLTLLSGGYLANKEAAKQDANEVMKNLLKEAQEADKARTQRTAPNPYQTDVFAALHKTVKKYGKKIRTKDLNKLLDIALKLQGANLAQQQLQMQQQFNKMKLVNDLQKNSFLQAIPME